jgi:hypothetical protein
MPTGVKPKSTDDPHDFVVIPSDQVRVAPSDAEITDLLRAAARHNSDAGPRAANDLSGALSVPAVDTTFRATAVNDDVPARKRSFGRRAMRAIAALLLTLGIGAAALSWQTFGYAAKKALFSWAPKWAIAASLPLEKLGLASESTPPDDAAPAQPAASAQGASDDGAPANATATTAASTPDTAQQLQSMARDLANANQQVEALKASIAELKASQQQMTRDLAKVSEQAAKAKVAAMPPHPPAHKPAPPYSSTSTYSPAATPAPPPAYRPVSSSYPATQAAAAPAAQPYVAPPPVQLQPEPGLASAPRPPMPVQ